MLHAAEQMQLLAEGGELRGGNVTWGCGYGGNAHAAMWSKPTEAKGRLPSVSHWCPSPPKPGGLLHLESAKSHPMQSVSWNPDLADPTILENPSFGAFLCMFTHTHQATHCSTGPPANLTCSLYGEAELCRAARLISCEHAVAGVEVRILKLRLMLQVCSLACLQDFTKHLKYIQL